MCPSLTIIFLYRHINPYRQQVAFKQIIFLYTVFFSYGKLL